MEVERAFFGFEQKSETVSTGNSEKWLKTSEKVI